MSRLAFALLGLSGLVVVAACSSSSSSELSAADYDATCTADTDCAVASFGDVCALNCNPNGAINRGALTKYYADYNAKNKDCPQVTYVRDPCEDTRRPHEARCTTGRCTVIEVVDAGASDAGADG